MSDVISLVVRAARQSNTFEEFANNLEQLADEDAGAEEKLCGNLADEMSGY